MSPKWCYSEGTDSEGDDRPRSMNAVNCICLAPPQTPHSKLVLTATTFTPRSGSFSSPHYAGPKEDLSSSQTRREGTKSRAYDSVIINLRIVFLLFTIKNLDLICSELCLAASLAPGGNSYGTLCGRIFGHDNNAVTRSGSII